MPRVVTPEEFQTILAYPTVEQADADAQIQEERQKKTREVPA